MAERAQRVGAAKESRTSPRRTWATVVVVWAAVTALAVAGAKALRLPQGFGREADVFDEAFRFLMYMGAPVFGAVVAVVVISVLAYRSRSPSAAASGSGAAPLDGEHIVAVPKLDAAWLVITFALTVMVIVNPGLVGLARFFDAGARDDHVVQVEAVRFGWFITYPDRGVTVTDELVLPVHRRTRFEVTSKDVVHAFWIPALRVKIDAVPGRTTTISTTPEKEGTFEQDEGLRLQCAEMCGVGHSKMAIPVKLVTPDEFDRWLSEQKAAPARRTR